MIALAPSVVSSPKSSPQPDSQRRPKDKREQATRSPATNAPLYAAFSACIEGNAVVWDVGCGDGRGTGLLVAQGRRIVGIDTDPHVLDLAKRQVPEATFQALLTSDDNSAPDIVVMVDVLTCASDPQTLLASVADRANPTATLLLAEPRAYIGQQLTAPKQRAFSKADLQSLLFSAGWVEVESYDVAHNFSVVSARPADRALAALLKAQVNGKGVNFDQFAPWLSQAPIAQRAHLHVHLARLAATAGSADLASHHYLLALECMPDLPAALSGLAELMLVCGSSADALGLVVRCLETHPTHVPALHLWLQLAGQGNTVEQLRTCQALASLTPADFEVQAALAQLHAASGNPDLAIQDLELIRSYQSQPNADLAITLAWLLDSVGRRADAQVEAKLAAMLAPHAVEVAELLNALDLAPLGAG